MQARSPVLSPIMTRMCVRLDMSVRLHVVFDDEVGGDEEAVESHGEYEHDAVVVLGGLALEYHFN